MELFEQFFGRRDQSWFENGGIGARQGTFQATALGGGRKIPVLGTVVAREGLAFISPSRIAESELQVSFTLRARPIEARVLVERGEPMMARAKPVHRYFCTFTSIAADDWDAVIRYVDNVPEPTGGEVVADADDAFLTLPSATQTAIVAKLVAARRLAPPKPGQVPLIRVSCGPVRQLGDGRIARDVSIRSRVNVDRQMTNFDTRVRIFSSGTVDLLE